MRFPYDTTYRDGQALLRYPGSNAADGSAWTCERALHDDKDKPKACRTDFAVVETFPRCALVQCLLHSGRYHQIRRMFAAVGNHVESLHRHTLGGLGLGDLPAGQWRPLTEADRAAIFRTL